MEQEAAEATTTTEAVEPSQTTEAAPQTTHNRPPGYDPVDPATATPEAIQQRIDFLYRQVRENKNEANHYKTMMAQKIDEVVNGLGTVVGHIQEKTFADTEASLNHQMDEAFQNGDMKAFRAAQNKLWDLQMEQKLGKKEQPKQEAKPQQQQYQESTLSPQDEAVISAWQDETDESGMPLRPWAKNRGTATSPDPQYLAALAEANAIMNSPRFSNLSTAEKMAEVDRRMGLKTTNRQSVMGAGLTNRPKTAKITLSPDAERLAIRMKMGGPNAKSDADHIAAYVKAKEAAQKGARK